MSHEGKALHNAIKASNVKVTDYPDLAGISNGTLYKLFKMEVLDDETKKKAAEILQRSVEDIFVKSSISYKVTGDELRRQKAFGENKDDGLIYVPVPAQAGYARHFMDSIFVSDLERIYIPGLKYKNDRYRYFEVEGDSMEPTIKEHMQVLAEKIEQEYWRSSQEFYIHVIVTNTQVLIKRIKLLDERRFIAISDNDLLYPQFSIEWETVRELWIVKRVLDWRMPPPKQFEITIN